MLEPRSFKQAMKRHAKVTKTEQLKPELRFVLENYNQHYDNYLAAKNNLNLQNYHKLRLEELEKWVVDEPGYSSLLNAIGKFRKRVFNFGAEKNIFELQSLLNYMGMLAEDKSINAAETFYGMAFLVDIIMFDDKPKQEKELNALIENFKSIFIYDQALNIAPFSKFDKEECYKIYARLAELARGKKEDLCGLIERKWGKEFFIEKPSSSPSLSPSRRSYSISLLSLELLPEWLSFANSPGSRRSSRSTSASTLTTSSSSSASISSSSSSSTISVGPT